ncbi:MAG TPA: cytochrome ubiquinol oxidase subunit I [Longilinea sp.]|nr:cytochrome ubiquinol oxidase subunit I [Longilinea sp.]
MDATVLSEWQFGITTVYHFFFVPLTLGLSVIVAIMETIYVRTANETYKRMAKFWGNLFIINFAMGVVTGIVMEFQFGMNWSGYSSFVGDIFGAPLALEALLAFFLESTFLGLWIFGWDRFSKGLHLTTIWLVAFASNLSAFFILTANSFMQNPVGYVEESGHLVMTNFEALLTNPYLWGQFPHTVAAGFVTAAFFVLGISAYHLVKKHEADFFNRSFSISLILAAISVVAVIFMGDYQGKQIMHMQPMKIASMEAMWNDENPAAFNLVAIPDQKDGQNLYAIKIPYMLSMLLFNRPEGEVEGISELQDQYSTQYGPGNYEPDVFVTFWTFRIMVGLGFLMAFIVLYGFYLVFRKKSLSDDKFIKLLPFAIAFPYIANTCGWVLTEMGRQPWTIFGLLKTSDAVSPVLKTQPGMVLSSLIIFTLLYAGLMVADAYLLVKYSKAGPQIQAAMVDVKESPIH